MHRRIAVLLVTAGLVTVAVETTALAAPASRTATISSAQGRSCSLNISGSSGAFNATRGYQTQYGLVISCNAAMSRGWGTARVRYTCANLSLSCEQSGPNCDMTGRSSCDTRTWSSSHWLSGFTVSTGTAGWPLTDGVWLELPSGDSWTSYPDMWNYRTKWACDRDQGFGVHTIGCVTEINGS